MSRISELLAKAQLNLHECSVTMLSNSSSAICATSGFVSDLKTMTCAVAQVGSSEEWTCSEMYHHMLFDAVLVQTVEELWLEEVLEPHIHQNQDRLCAAARRARSSSKTNVFRRL